ncbi:hypothetical protein [Saccharopolyspora griseoalba]|uniref:DUF2569 domain-containing protein n=1 Tax=Saccharopolyspora griseoalba TaxID=1431848 RepID=A0ABW2LK87_9PSEU
MTDPNSAGRAGLPDPFAAPPIPEHELRLPPPPRPVLAAFWIALALPVLATLLDVVMWFAERQDVQEMLVGAAPPEDRAARAVAAFLVVLVTLFDLALTALWIAFGFQLRAGKHWARVVLTAFASIWAVLALMSLVEMPLARSVAPESAPAGGLAALTAGQNATYLVAAVAFVVLVYRPSSNEFFRARRRF